MKACLAFGELTGPLALGRRRRIRRGYGPSASSDDSRSVSDVDVDITYFRGCSQLGASDLASRSPTTNTEVLEIAG